METLLSETSRMGDGSLERGSWRFRVKIPVVRNPDSRLHFIDPNYKLTSRFKRDGKNCLLKLPFVLTSLFHSCRIFLHNSFIDEKTQTSSGCNKCVAFGGSIAKYTSFCSAILITSRLKWEAKLSPKSTYFPGFSATVFIFQRTIAENKQSQTSQILWHCKCSLLTHLSPMIRKGSWLYKQPSVEGTLQRHFHTTWLILEFYYGLAHFLLAFSHA